MGARPHQEGASDHLPPAPLPLPEALMEEERGRAWGPRSGALSSISAGSTAERTSVSKETALLSQELPKSREPAASTSDPQTGGQTPSLHPVTQETLDLGKEGLLPGSKESGEAGWAGCCHEGTPTSRWSQGYGAQLSPRMPRRTRGHGPQSSWSVTGFPEEPSRSPTSSSIGPLRE